MKAIEDMNKDELTNAVLFEDDMSLYERFDEQRFLAGEYSEDELRAEILAWIMEAPETI
mgnify:FL=1